MRGKRRKRVLAGLSMIAGFVIAQGLQAAAVRSCPHHTGSGQGVVAAVHGSAVAHAETARDAGHGGHAGHDSSHDDRSSHDGPCDCLGPCGGTAVLDPPPDPSESVFAQVAPRRQALRGRDGAARTLRSVPFALPYPNAPPA